MSMVTLLLFLCVIAGETILETAATGKYFDRNRFDFHEREAMKELLDSMVKDFDNLAGFDADNDRNPVLENIRNRYARYNITIKDISSGCNLNFLPESDLAEPALMSFLFAGGNAEGFLRFRRNHGFATDVTVWKPFLREEALGAVVCYGWLPTIHKETEAGSKLAASFNGSGDEMFPIMNDLPLINVNTMDTALLGPLLSHVSWRIPGAAAKAASLKARLENGPVTEAELRTLLGLGENHVVYRYLGVRTAFWALSFKNDRYRMDAIIAAVPERNSKIINHYILIEGRLSHAI